MPAIQCWDMSPLLLSNIVPQARQSVLVLGEASEVVSGMDVSMTVNKSLSMIVQFEMITAAWKRRFP